MSEILRVAEAADAGSETQGVLRLAMHRFG